MTQIYVHPHIPDHFVEYDMQAIRNSPADSSAQDLRRSVMQDYVGERVVLLRNIRLDYDRDFVRSIQFPATWTFKKFPSHIVEGRPFSLSTWREILRQPAAWRDLRRDLVETVFQGDTGRYQYFRAQIRHVNKGLRDVLDEILRGYRVTGRDITWRYTETRVENLHMDIDNGSDNFESIRMYLNMDDVPRMWHTSYGLTDLLARYYDELGLKTMAGEPLERLLSVMSQRLFGNWKSRGREQFPRHMALFEPDDVWLVDGRSVPHQVLYGRRVAATFYKLDSKGLPDWHPSLSERVKRIHADGGVRDRAPLDMAGYRFPFGAKGPAAAPGVTAPKSLKREWETIYRDSIQQRLVRL